MIGMCLTQMHQHSTARKKVLLQTFKKYMATYKAVFTCIKTKLENSAKRHCTLGKKIIFAIFCNNYNCDLQILNLPIINYVQI